MSEENDQDVSSPKKSEVRKKRARNTNSESIFERKKRLEKKKEIFK
jgi:hypothetical protein